MNLSNHGYLKPGQWIQLTRELTTMSLLDASKTTIKSGTYCRFEMVYDDSRLVFSYGKDKTFVTKRSNIRYLAISPKKSSTLEALYGNNTKV